MIEKFGERIGPVSLVFGMSIIGMMAALIVLTSTTGPAQAQCPADDPLCYHDPFATSDELTAPSNVKATSNTAGTVTITWEGGENADSFILVALDLAGYAAGDARYYETASVGNGLANTGDVSALTSGKEYAVLVIALQGTGADEVYEFGFGTDTVTVQ